MQALDSDEALKVAVRADTLADAQAALDRHDVFAVVAIPKDTERYVCEAYRPIAAYVDAAYFLLYSRTLQGISESSRGRLCRDLQRGARSEASLVYAAMARSGSPIDFLSQPLFNPTGGYASYVVPAAFILILQQTLLLGVASLGGATYALGGPASRRLRFGPARRFGQGLAHLCLALPGLALYPIVLPRVYGFSTLGRLEDLILMAVPFVFSVSFLAQFASAWFRRRETAILLFIAVSLPLFFQVGVSWPVEALPDFIRAASRVFPSTSAIDGFVRINQMGASILEVKRDWTTLWIFDVVYGLLAAASDCHRLTQRGSPWIKRPDLRDPRARRRDPRAAPAAPFRFETQRKSTPPPIGVVHETEIRIAPDISARLASLSVKAATAGA